MTLIMTRPFPCLISGLFLFSRKVFPSELQMIVVLSLNVLQGLVTLALLQYLHWSKADELAGRGNCSTYW